MDFRKKNEDGSLKIIKMPRRLGTLKVTPEETMKVAFTDVETTGLDGNIHKIIELGVVLTEVCLKTGLVIKGLDVFESYNDPEEQISERITKINNINNDMVKGIKIDWSEKGKAFGILNSAQMIVCHNTKFDRSFLVKQMPMLTKKVWGCSQSQIDWLEDGMEKNNLIILCMAHGFYYDAHKALDDCLATTVLMRCKSRDGRFYLKHIMDDLKKPKTKVIVRGNDYNQKELWKEEGFAWDFDKQAQVAFFDGPADEVEKEVVKDLEKKRLSFENIECVKITPAQRFAP
jgi:DNA polymerase III subunit epsilon